jgi:hypothetical protein
MDMEIIAIGLKFRHNWSVVDNPDIDVADTSI